MLLSTFQESVCQELTRFTLGLAFLHSKSNEEENKHTCLSAMTSAIVSSLLQF